VSEVTQDAPEPAFWIRWPVLVIAVGVFLPLRLVWELLRLVGRLLARYAARPLGWCWREVVVGLVWRYCVALPFRLLWRFLGVVYRLLERLFVWGWRQLLADALLGRYVVRPLAWVWRHVIVWFLRNVVERLGWFLVRYLLIVPLEWLWPRLVVAPVMALNRMIAWFLRVSAPWRRRLGQALARGFAWLLREIVRWGLRPGWRVAAAAGRWLRKSLLVPAAAVVRSLFSAFRR
jgi:hypothetical protein